MSQIVTRPDAESHASLNHWIAERVFDWSGLGVTHLRPTLPEATSATVIQLTSAPDLGGMSVKAFYDGCEQPTSACSHDVTVQQRLWQVNAELTNLAALADLRLS